MTRPWLVTLTVKDEKGQVSRVSASFPVVAYPTLLEGHNWIRDPFWHTGLLAEAVRPLITGAITSVSLSQTKTYLVGDPEVPMIPQPNSDVEEVAVLKFRAGSGFFDLALPTIREDLLTKDGQIIMDPDVVNLVSLLTGQVSHPNLYSAYTDRRGRPIASFVSGREGWRAR